MRHALCSLVLFALGVAALAVPAGASTTHSFKADLQDKDVCPGFDQCGSGIVHRFGHATTTLSFATLERVITLDSDGSTLRLTLEPTDFTPPKFEGTFTVVGGTGIFEGATGSGVVWATATGVPVPSDTAHYRGTLTLEG